MGRFEAGRFVAGEVRRLVWQNGFVALRQEKENPRVAVGFL